MDDDHWTLQQVKKLAEDNNRMLRRLYHGLWWSRLWSLVYWLIVIGFALGAFYFLQPYLQKLQQAYSGLQSEVNTVQQIGSKITNGLQQP